jgi:circadian clock protein KaiB
MAQRKRRPARGLESAAPAATPERHLLRLYVTGATERSLRAIANVKDLCERYLEGRYDLEVVDIYQQPALASRDQIVAAPTLVKRLPVPVRYLVGDLSRTEQVLRGLGLVAQAS